MNLQTYQGIKKVYKSTMRNNLMSKKTILFSGFLGPSFLKKNENYCYRRSKLPPFLSNDFIELKENLDFSVLDKLILIM